MRTSAEFLSDLQPVIDRIAGGPMNRIDVLASIEFAINLCDALPKGESYTKDLRAAHAAVDELIMKADNAAIVLSNLIAARQVDEGYAGIVTDLTSVLARIGATP